MKGPARPQQPNRNTRSILTANRSILLFSILFLVGIQVHYSSVYLKLEWAHKSLIEKQEELSNLPIADGRQQRQQRRWPSHPTAPSQPHKNALLTIAVDSYGSCPENCHFVHNYLPGWVQYRYINFVDENDLETLLKDGPTTHLLILARTNIVNLSLWAKERRLSTNTFVALWHMADERVHGGEIQPTYRHFDFVIRNYWRWKVDFREAFNMTLRALGNHTCGTSPPLVPSVSDTDVDDSEARVEPRFGVHWAFLGAHDLHNLLLHEPTSNWPTSQRTSNCSFQGRPDRPRMQHTRTQMKDAIDTTAADLNCSISFTGGFGMGATKWDYLIGDLQQTKIGLCPGGTSVETHRLAETLQMGSVPALLDQPYLHAPFRKVPAIIGENWTYVAETMKDLIAEELEATRQGRKSNLERLQLDGAHFFHELQDCMRWDVDTLLRLAADHYSHDSPRTLHETAVERLK